MFTEYRLLSLLQLKDVLKLEILFNKKELSLTGKRFSVLLSNSKIETYFQAKVYRIMVFFADGEFVFTKYTSVTLKIHHGR